jgi:exosortase
VSQAVQVDPVPATLEGRSRWNFWVLPASALVLAVAWLYFPIAVRLGIQWFADPNFTHGIFVPAFSAFVIWEKRKHLRALPVQPSWAGLAVLVLGLGILAVGVMGAELFLSRVSFLIVAVGLMALFLGWNHVRACWFPLAFLLLMIPIPSIIFNQITTPLQTIASISAAHLLPWFGVPVLREGNIIRLPTMALEVAVACSGIRSLMSLATLSIIYGYLMESSPSIRVLLALASVPIAVAANSLRIVGTGLIVQYWDPEKAEGFFHAFSGWLVFVVSLLLLFLVHRFFRLFVKGS